MLTDDCESFINGLIKKGGKIVSERHEGSPDLYGKLVFIIKDKCSFKISYLTLGEKQIIVQKTCCCNNNNIWKNIPSKCNI